MDRSASVVYVVVWSSTLVLVLGSYFDSALLSAAGRIVQVTIFTADAVVLQTFFVTLWFHVITICLPLWLVFLLVIISSYCQSNTNRSIECWHQYHR